MLTGTAQLRVASQRVSSPRRYTAVTNEARKRLPPRVLYEINRLRGCQVPEPIALEVLELLRRVDQGWLRDPQRLPTLIREMGLSDHHPHIMPASTYWWLGRGLRTLQYPHQFAAYLTFLADKPITSYAEIGIESGGSFATTIAYLEATGHEIERALAIDPQYSPGIARLQRRHSAVRYLRAISSDPVVHNALQQRSWGLIFIDGDHSYSTCRADFELARKVEARMIALHDIVDGGCPGVRRVWNEICLDYADAYEFLEFTDQYPDVTAWTRTTHFGIGVAVAKP
jgi:cephalosporin hydroxylase